MMSVTNRKIDLEDFREVKIRTLTDPERGTENPRETGISMDLHETSVVSQGTLINQETSSRTRKEMTLSLQVSEIHETVSAIGNVSKEVIRPTSATMDAHHQFSEDNRTQDMVNDMSLEALNEATRPTTEETDLEEITQTTHPTGEVEVPTDLEEARPLVAPQVEDRRMILGEVEVEVDHQTTEILMREDIPIWELPPLDALRDQLTTPMSIRTQYPLRVKSEDGAGTTRLRTRRFRKPQHPSLMARNRLIVFSTLSTVTLGTSPSQKKTSFNT